MDFSRNLYLYPSYGWSGQMTDEPSGPPFGPTYPRISPGAIAKLMSQLCRRECVKKSGVSVASR
jgi:hypothetical protein